MGRRPESDTSHVRGYAATERPQRGAPVGGAEQADPVQPLVQRVMGHERSSTTLDLYTPGAPTTRTASCARSPTRTTPTTRTAVHVPQPRSEADAPPSLRMRTLVTDEGPDYKPREPLTRAVAGRGDRI